MRWGSRRLDVMILPWTVTLMQTLTAHLHVFDHIEMLKECIEDVWVAVGEREKIKEAEDRKKFKEKREKLERER